MTKENVHFGLMGPGKVAGRFLAPALAKARGACLWSVLGRESERTHEFARTHQAKAPHSAFVNLDEFLKDPELDAVLIATPDNLHAECAIAALEAGRPVLIEKPVCSSAAEAWRVADTAERTALPAGVGYHLRFHAGSAGWSIASTTAGSAHRFTCACNGRTARRLQRRTGAREMQPRHGGP
jgi:1,5-anhydro-D-fructose reductase (1,5-anhydro-D-mannitol-forming)